MAKKISMIQRLMEFGLGADPKEIEGAIDTLKACLNARSPKQKVSRKKTGPTRGRTSTQLAGDASDGASSES